MKRHRAILYMALMLSAMLMGGFVLFYYDLLYQSVRVTIPHGWVVEKGELITKDVYRGETRTVIDEGGVSIEFRRDNRIRIIRYIAPNKMHVVVYQTDARGNPQLVRESRLTDEKIPNKINGYKNNLFIQKEIPDSNEIINFICNRYGVKKNNITIKEYHGRDSLYLKTPHIAVYLDRYTGVELVRYVRSSNGWEPVWWLKSARLELRRGSKKGLYEIRLDE